MYVQGIDGLLPFCSPALLEDSTAAATGGSRKRSQNYIPRNRRVLELLRHLNAIPFERATEISAKLTINDKAERVNYRYLHSNQLARHVIPTTNNTTYIAAEIASQPVSTITQFNGRLSKQGIESESSPRCLLAVLLSDLSTKIFLCAKSLPHYSAGLGKCHIPYINL